MRLPDILPSLLREHEIEPQGIVHVGAHQAQERDVYRDCGFARVVWIEADPALAESLISDGLDAIHTAIVEKPGPVVFHRTEGSQQASVLEPRRYTVRERVTVPGKRLDTFTFDDCNVLVLDIQGAEYAALRSDNNLKRWNMVVSECGRKARYHGQVLRPIIERYMHEHGFRLVREIPHGRSPVADLVWIRQDV